MNPIISPKFQRLKWLGPLSQLACIAAIGLERLGNPALDFSVGALIGFSIVGNLAFLIYFGTECRLKSGRS